MIGEIGRRWGISKRAGGDSYEIQMRIVIRTGCTDLDIAKKGLQPIKTLKFYSS